MTSCNNINDDLDFAPSCIPPGSFSDHYVMGKMEIDLALLEDCEESQI